MQALMYDSMALYAPNFNSQRRFLGPFVPTQPRLGPQQPQRRLSRAAGGRAKRGASSTGSPGPTPVRTWRWPLSWLRCCMGSRIGWNRRAPIDGRAIDSRRRRFSGGLDCGARPARALEASRQYIPARYLRVYSEVKRGEYGELIEQVFHREYDFYA